MNDLFVPCTQDHCSHGCQHLESFWCASSSISFDAFEYLDPNMDPEHVPKLDNKAKVSHYEVLFDEARRA